MSKDYGDHRKFLFLDFDGVLNSSRTFGDRKKAMAQYSEAERSVLSRLDVATYEIDRSAVALLNAIVELTDCAIVISSTWRRFYSLTDLKTVLAVAGLNDTERVISATPHLNQRAVFRGNEIYLWLDTFQHEFMLFDERDEIRYAILDDDSDMLLWQKDHFVKTKFETGLTEKEADRVVAILNAP